MTITLTFKPEVEAGLLAKARDRGMDLQEYVQAVVEHEVMPSFEGANVSGRTPRQEAVRRMIEFGDKYRLSLGEPMSRESLHEGHRF